MKLPPRPVTALDGHEPSTEDELRQHRRDLVDEFLAAPRRRKEELLAEIVGECQSDRDFLYRLLEEIEPLRKNRRGRRTEKWTKARHIQLLVEIASLEPRSKYERQVARESVGELHHVSADEINERITQARKLVQESDLPAEYRWILTRGTKPPRK